MRKASGMRGIQVGPSGGTYSKDSTKMKMLGMSSYSSFETEWSYKLLKCLSGISAKRHDDDREVERWLFRLARVDSCVATVVCCFIERETQCDQMQKFYENTQGTSRS